MRPSLAIRAPRQLRIIQVGVHGSIRIDEPGVDIASSIGRVVARACDDPRHSVIQDRIGHGLECACIVYESTVRVELAITNVVGACYPDLSDWR